MRVEWATRWRAGITVLWRESAHVLVFRGSKYIG